MKPKFLPMVSLLILCGLAIFFSLSHETLAGPVVENSGFGSPSRELTPRLQALLNFRTAAVRDDGSPGLQKRRLSGEKSPSALNAVLLMCDFSDSLMVGRFGIVPGDFPAPRQREIYYSAHDSVYFDHLLQDVADYYNDVSGGVFTLNYTIHPRTVNLPHPMSFYGNHPDEGEQSLLMAADVVESLDAEIDFSLFDTVILVHAGAGEETDILGNSPEQVYSTYLDPGDFQDAQEEGQLEFPYLPTGDHPEGQGIDHVLVLPETEYQDPVQSFDGFFGSLGVYCFEVGLRLGMLSLSDFTPGGRPDSQGIGEFGLMGYGLFVSSGWIPPHPCAFNKYLMGWLNPQEVSPSAGGNWSLSPCEDSAGPDAAIRVDITGQEYWLLTYRLQDPDGNRIFSLPRDLNDNNVPDFYDEDSLYGDGTPTSYFDPDSGDERESLLGCEWDFFMSSNDARAPYVKGAGSGVYIWHIDEGVIEGAFGQPTNLFNADADHKSVDLEEADGIQDLDSSIPSVYQLGCDDDSFRGEGNSTFDPWSKPRTDTAHGAFTGVRFADFSTVLLDTAAFISYINTRVDPPDTIMGYTYATSVTFTLSVAESNVNGPGVVARRTLPDGIDLRGSHLVLADLNGDGTDEIIAAGHAGELLVMDGQLNEFLDHDGESTTFEPFATGTRDGEPVVWNLPPAVGNIAGDSAPEIVLTAANGIYAFDIHGMPVVDPLSGSNGLYLSLLGECSLPPVLIPASGEGMYSAEAPAWVCVVVTESGNSRLECYQGLEPTLMAHWDLGSGVVPAPPTLSWGKLIVTVADAENGNHRLLYMDAHSSPNSQLRSLSLVNQPGSQPPLLGLVDFSNPESSLRFAVVLDPEGRGETLIFDQEGTQALDNILWNDQVQASSGIAPGGALVGGGVLGRAGHNGGWSDGWPVRPRHAIEPSLLGSGPLVCELMGVELPQVQYLFPVSDGRVFGQGAQGDFLGGWPLAGPGKSAGTPALGVVSGGESLDLVAVGTFDRILGLDSQGEQLVSSPVSSMVVWAEVAKPGAVWPMWGGSPWHNGSWDMAAWPGLPETQGGQAILAGSHLCYPSPLGEGPLYVRGSASGFGRAQAAIYDLSGDVVETSLWQPVSAGEPFTITMNLNGVVTGMYLCRLTVELDEAGTVDHSVISVAIVR